MFPSLKPAALYCCSYLGLWTQDLRDPKITHSKWRNTREEMKFKKINTKFEYCTETIAWKHVACWSRSHVAHKPANRTTVFSQHSETHMAVSHGLATFSSARHFLAFPSVERADECEHWWWIAVKNQGKCEWEREYRLSGKIPGAVVNITLNLIGIIP